jgi:hypothetical protein
MSSTTYDCHVSKIVVIDQSWAYAIMVPTHYDAAAITHEDAQQDSRILTLDREWVENFARGHERLGGEMVDTFLDHYVYTADETQSCWLVTLDDVVELGASLGEGQPDAYSRWCADTCAMEVED